MHRPRRHAALPLLLALAPLCAAVADFCDGDPRVRASTHACPRRRRPRQAVLVPPLPASAPLALHDHLWALAHYLRACSARLDTTLVFAHAPPNASRCAAAGPWPACLALHLARAALPPDRVRHAPRPAWWRPPPSAGCFEKRVALGLAPPASAGAGILSPHFRELSWLGRDCSSPRPRRPWQRPWECAGRPVPAALVDLPGLPRRAAFRLLRRAAAAAAPKEGPAAAGVMRGWRGAEPSAVRVLLYGREEGRRRWVNVGKVWDALRRDARVVPLRVREMPAGFGELVQLFRGADVAVSVEDPVLANAAFMREGSEVVQVARDCGRDVEMDGWRPRAWVGWMADYTGVGVSYLACEWVGGKGKDLKVGGEVLHVVSRAVARVARRKRDGEMGEARDGAEGRLRGWAQLRQWKASGSAAGFLAGAAVCWALAVLSLRRRGRRKGATAAGRS